VRSRGKPPKAKLGKRKTPWRGERCGQSVRGVKKEFARSARKLLDGGDLELCDPVRRKHQKSIRWV